jgi:hypothetical protein
MEQVELGAWINSSRATDLFADVDYQNDKRSGWFYCEASGSLIDGTRKTKNRSVLVY